MSAAYFDHFDARPTAARFVPAIEGSLPAGSRVVVLGHADWHTECGGRNDVLGDDRVQDA